MIYLDYHATTPVDPRVVSAMTRFNLLPKDNHFKIASMITG